MKMGLKVTALLLLINFTILALGYFFWYRQKAIGTNKNIVLSPKRNYVEDKSFIKKINSNADALLSYCKANNYNSAFCFLMDMSIPSGRRRFFVYNFKKDSIEVAGLVTHGSGSIRGGKELFFSNKPGSNCTSLGKYWIGNDYNGRFGLAYKLHGLDGSNNKAFERFVVLHAHSCVPASEVYPSYICPSLGCPTVSPAFLQTLKKYIDAPGKRILLYIYK